MTDPEIQFPRFCRSDGAVSWRWEVRMHGLSPTFGLIVYPVGAIAQCGFFVFVLVGVSIIGRARRAKAPTNDGATLGDL